LAAALQTLVQLPSVDPTRLVALGASHGGYLSLMTLMHPAIQPKPTAGVSISGVVDVASWVSYLRSVPKTINLLPGLHHYAFQTIPRTLGWPPDKDSRVRERFARISVLTYVKNLQAPLLLIHGARDVHVPPNQAQMLIVALQLEQKNYEAVTAANQGTDDHFLFQHNSEIWKKIADFLQRTLAPDTPAVSNQ
jgi:dipeptidyl aminopeptidase/acylaminoacyl peptidase